jgi:hypothetical protein
VDVGSLVAACYGRMIALHVAILVGGSLVVALGQPIVPLMILVGVKIFTDLAGHITEHRTPRIAAYTELAEAHGEVQMPSPGEAQPEPQVRAPAVNPDARPLSHYVGGWRLRTGENAPPGWFDSIAFVDRAGKLGVHLTSQAGTQTGETLAGAKVHGTTSAIDWIELRLHGAGRERILRFAPSQLAGAAGLELTEVQQPEGNPKAAQMRSFSLVRA